MSPLPVSAYRTVHTDIQQPASPAPLKERVDGSSLLSLSVGKQKRLVSALTDDYFLYPIDRSTYQVLSYSNKDEPSIYTVSVFHTPICECTDFVLQCAGKDKWCKHILRVWAEISVGDLPPLGADPVDWLTHEYQQSLLDLINVLDAYRSQNNEPPSAIVKRSQALRDSLNELTSTAAPTEAQMEHFTRVWKEHRTER
jgi:hypothetical protein